MVLTGTGAAPPAPRAAGSRTLGASVRLTAAFTSLLISAAESEGGQRKESPKQPCIGSPCQPLPFPVANWPESCLPKWPPTASPLEKLGQLLPFLDLTCDVG